MSKTDLNEKLFEALRNFSVEELGRLLEQGASANSLDKNSRDKWTALDESLYKLGDDRKSYSIIKSLLQYNANVNEKAYLAEAILYSEIDDKALYLDIVTLLLEFGADPNSYEIELKTPLFCSDSQTAHLLLNYGGRPHYFSKVHAPDFLTIDDYMPVDDYFPLHKACAFLECELIKLLLDNGSDVAIKDDDECLAIERLEEDSALAKKNSLDESNQERKEFKVLLNPSNPPYLKLDGSGNKYIIYKRQDSDIHLLASFSQSHEEHFLYHGFDFSLFAYWAHQKGLLIEDVSKLFTKVPDTLEVIIPNALVLMVSSVSQEWTVDYFTEEGKAFAVGYLTVTNWAYSFHYDLKKLYPTKEAFATIPEKQEEYDLIFKMLDMRYQQFNSGDYFNANQNREELLAQIEGKEPRPRYMQLQEKL